ncbi:hypothetical protein [Gordonia sp. 1D]|uniref:hypothetical protein n=1 Tax=Gordonia sp. 1D TaxID=1737359 RepID=UPI000BB7F62C|nr:hypothetical protein [Gordonia sp. 1D]ATD71668.1 hypothetical protein CNO18_16765 [Gordonia sp. 1D]
MTAVEHIGHPLVGDAQKVGRPQVRRQVVRVRGAIAVAGPRVLGVTFFGGEAAIEARARVEVMADP